jgi:hypothetical protein
VASITAEDFKKPACHDFLARPARGLDWCGRRALLVVLFLLATCGCTRAPLSRFPNAASALQRMHATVACSRGLQIEAKADYFENSRRVRGSLALLAVLPDNLRVDVYSPFGLSLSTLTSDGNQFGLYELQSRHFLWGPASPCNMARFTRVSLPPFVLVQLLRGEAPVLIHEPDQASIDWQSSWFGKGHYTLEIRGRHQTVQRIELEPAAGDWSLPWQQQRLRVSEVTVSQAGRTLYRVMLEGHAAAQTAPAREDPDGLESPIMPSGPPCSAEVPRRIRFISAGSDTDFIISYSRVQHNPPLLPTVFQQPIPGGVSVLHSECVD